MIKLDKVSKKFGTGTLGLSDVSLMVEKGEFVFIVGTTGSGKTTLLRLLIRDTLATEGNIQVDEFDIVNLPKNKLTSLRKKIGMIFQDLKLLSDRTIFENVVLPLEVSGANQKEAIVKVENVLRQVGLLEHRDKFPIQLSGGEVQRVAIARALILSPEIILADEPTGNLDAATSWEIIKILSDINKNGTTIIMATHNVDIVKSMNKRVIQIEKGKVIKDEEVNIQEKKQVHEKEHHQKTKPEEKEVHPKEKDNGEEKK